MTKTSFGIVRAHADRRIASIFTALCLVACAAAPREVQPPAAELDHSVDVRGRWIGTYFQDDIHRAYSMELTADGSSDEFAVTLDWPELSQSRTLGHGTTKANGVIWTEEQLVRGRDIALNGRYTAALVDQDTLAGVYEKDSRRRGFFTLSPKHDSEKPAASVGQDQEYEALIGAAAAGQLRALQQEYSDAQDSCIKAMRALPESEQANYYEAHRPDKSAFTKRIRALADVNPRTPVAAQALLWIVENNMQTPVAQDAVEELIKDHGSSAELGRACLMLRFDRDARAADLLDRARKESSSSAVRGKATFALAEFCRRAVERQMASEADGMLTNRADTATRAEALYEEVVSEHANEEFLPNRTLGDAARSALVELCDLGVGQTAPEIDGEDLDGVKFKLSDYRGKVVVLDFWGNW
jgi:hypothetical protein